MNTSFDCYSYCDRLWQQIIISIDGTKEYRDFCRHLRSDLTIIAVTVVIVLIFIPLSYMAALASDFDGQYLFCFIAYLILSISIISLLITRSINQLLAITIFEKYSSLITSFFFVGITIVNGLFLLFRVLSGPCKSNDFQNQWACNPLRNEIPLNNIVLNMWITIAFIALFRCIRWSIHLIVWLLSVIFLIVSVIIAERENFGLAWISVISYLVLGGVVIHELKRQSFNSFKLHKRLEATIDELAELKESEYAEEIRHLIANVAHDLRTPLSAFIGGIDQIQHIVNQLAREFTEPSESKEGTIASIANLPTQPKSSLVQSYLSELFDRITEIFDTNQFMLMVINRCIDHSKVANNVALLPSVSSFDLWNAINFPVDCIRRVQNSTSIYVQINDSLHQKVIMSDKIWFTENIFCLLSNAVKYSDESEAELRVTYVDMNHPYRDLLVSHSMHRQLEASNPQTFLLVELFDLGKGIPEDKIQTLFLPFKQAQRRAGGTGLGLYSLACRMRALGGYYGARNRTDRHGAVFWFAIPYKEDELAQVEHPSTGTVENQGKEDLAKSAIKGAAASLPMTVDISPMTPYTSTGPGNVNPLTILLVDDTVPIQKILANILRRYGHRVDIAENGLKAIRSLGMMSTRTTESHEQAATYDVILMDLQMPIMDGFEAIARIRTYENVHHLPHYCIIAMSANSDETTMSEAIHGGADLFMPKPFQMDTFNRLYHEYIANLRVNNSSAIITPSIGVVV